MSAEEKNAEKGGLTVDWSHAGGCPGNVSILDARWLQQYELCTCGMPSWGEISVLQELAAENWKKRVDSGEADQR